MYAKLFSSLYQGTLRGQSHEILVFTNLLAHTGRDGTVDKHFRAIAEETGLTVDDVKAAILVLEAPDPESRSPEEGGARIVRLDEHRVWGWRVVNHGKYRAIRSEDDRAEQNRLAQARYRERLAQSKPSVSIRKPSKPMQRQRQRQRQRQEAETEASNHVTDLAAPQHTPSASPNGAIAKARKPTETDEEWIEGIEKMEAYKAISIRQELGKAQLWCSNKGRRCTRAFFTNWINRAVVDVRTIRVEGSNRGHSTIPGEHEALMKNVPIYEP